MELILSTPLKHIFHGGQKMARKKNRDQETDVQENGVVSPTAEKDADRALRKAKNVAKRTAKKDAIKKLIAFVKGNSEDKELLLICKLLTPGQRFGGMRTGAGSIIEEAFLEVDSWDEDTIWKQYKLGRAEMRKICVNLIKKKAPADRLWISFVSETGIYTLEATGPDAPADWIGYQPIDMEEMDI